MQQWITIFIYNLPQDAYMMKSLLESYDIAVYLKDELTIQTDNFLSNAMGGVKVQVKSADMLRAQQILEEHGYIKPNDKNDTDLWAWIQKKVAHIPVLNKMHPVLVFILIVSLLLFMFVFYPLIIDSTFK